MKNIKTLSRLTALALVFVMLFSLLVACEPDENNENLVPDDFEIVTIKVTANTPVATIKGDETVTLSVEVTGTENTAYTWTTVPEGILTISADNVVSISPDANLTANKKVSVIATSVADPDVSASKSFIVQAPTTEGSVGALTSEMIEHIGNASITVTGTVTDYYEDLLDVTNNDQTSYDTFVKMTDGKWIGIWGVTGSNKTITDYYRRDDESAEVKDENGEWGKPVDKLYIGKNNTLVAEPVKNNRTYVLWNSRHLWNHLGELDVNRFTQIEDTNEYKYTLDVTDIDDLYLMTYLSYCLTPMMSETLATIVFTVENGAITKMRAQTEMLYYVGSEIIDTAKDAERVTYTIAEFTFSDVGTTVIEDPEGYEAPQYAEKLEAALNNLKNATNYTFEIVDTQTRVPSSDAGDYEMMSVSGDKGASMLAALATSFPYANTKSASGTIGEKAFVVDDKIVIKKTGKYSYGMDDKLYHTEYYGFKTRDDSSYEEFYYDPDAKGFVGDKIWLGNMMEDYLPTFELSANIFQCVSYNMVDGLYTFTLREGAAMMDVASVLAPYGYAKNAKQSINGGGMTVVVTEDGGLKSVSFPYDISDIYAGIYTISFKNVGTTTLQTYELNGEEVGVFDNYIPRVVPTSWSAFEDDSYYHKHTTLCENYGGCSIKDAQGEITGWDHSAHTKTLDLIIKDLFGASASKVPAPNVFTDAFGDTMSSAVGFNWKEGAVAGTYIDYIAFNLQADDYDRNENYYEEAIARITAALTELGYTVDQANTDVIGGDGAYSDRTITFITEGKDGAPGVQIVIENNRTSHFFVRIYKAGEWKL